MNYLLVIFLSSVLALGGVEKKKPNIFFPTYDETKYDFGHIAIDYDVYHNYVFENRTGDTLRITDINVSCDCSTVLPSDTIIPPGDTILFKLRFNTKDAFGPTNRSFTVSTDNPKLQKITYQYFSIIGQWFNGIIPKPFSLFFLPGQKAKKVVILNTKLPKISIKKIEQFDNSFSVKPLSSKTVKGDSLELEVKPRDNLKSGTYRSSFTVYITQDNDDKEMILTIPVKIVMY